MTSINGKKTVKRKIKYTHTHTPEHLHIAKSSSPSLYIYLFIYMVQLIAMFEILKRNEITEFEWKNDDDDDDGIKAPIKSFYFFFSFFWFLFESFSQINNSHKIGKKIINKMMVIVCVCDSMGK